MQFGSVSGQTFSNIPEYVFYNPNNLQEEIPDNETIILDFWNSHCAVCFSKFPLLDSINRTHKSGARVILVNVPLNGERKEDNFKLLDSYHYSFKQLFAKDSSIVQNFDFEYYPTTFIIKNNMIVFKGDIEDGLKYL